MPGKAFFDTNVLLYTLEEGSRRQEIATGLIVTGGAISVQCLNEFVRVARGKLGLAWAAVEQASSEFQELCGEIVSISLDVHRSGMSLAQRYGFSVFDAMIVAAALESNCGTLYSEDMHDGLVVGGRLTIVNPFRA